MKTNRLTYIDIARALCTIWIVAIWHMFDYYPNAQIKNHLPIITIGALGCFTFISGLFCGKKNTPPLKFYQSRIKRFFILLLISCITLYPLSFFKGGVLQLLLTISGLSCFLPPQAPTVWYFSMLIMFYWLTPIILIGSTRNRWFILINGIVIYCIFLICNSFFNIDTNILKYFPLYILGILTPMSFFENLRHYIAIRKVNGWYLSAICLLILSILIWINSINIVFSIIAEIVMSFFLILLGISIQNKYCINIFSLVSFASMCAYLFHRQIYAVFKVLFSNEYCSLPYWCLPLMIISVLIISYYIQFLYNKIIK